LNFSNARFSRDSGLEPVQETLIQEIGCKIDVLKSTASIDLNEKSEKNSKQNNRFIFCKIKQ